MIKKYFIIILLCAVVPGVLYAKPTVTFDNDLQSISLKDKKLYRYSMVEKNVNLDAAANLAKDIVYYSDSPISTDLPSSKNENENENDVIHFMSTEDPSSYIEINPKMGDILLNGGFQRYQGNAHTPALLNKGQAKEKIKEHLKNIGLSVNPIQIQDIQIGGLNMAVHHENGETENFNKFTVVRISRQMDGIPVLGASRIVARLAEHGKLHSFVYRWIEVMKEALAEKDLLDDQSIEKLISHRIIEKGREAKKIHIAMKTLALYDDGNGVIEPVIFIGGTRTFGEEIVSTRKKAIEGSIDFYIPLVKKSKLRLPDSDDYNVSIPKDDELVK